MFHQLLQVHSMLSAPGYFPKTGVDDRTALVNTQINMLGDGLFHAVTWSMTLLGVGLLWAAAGRADVPRSTRTLAGAMLLGWGLFNAVEGVIDHHILHVHHLTEGPSHLVWDVLFLLSGVGLALAGVLVMGRSRGEGRGVRG